MMRHCRRSLLALAAGPFLAACNSGTPGDGSFAQPLEIESRVGVLDATLHVTLTESRIGERTVRGPAYNGTVPGPTLRVRPGDLVRIRLVNGMPPAPEGGEGEHDESDSTNLHFHGLHVSPEGRADNVSVHVHAGDSFDYEFRIPDEHPGGLYWYHPHHHGNVEYQLASGLSGAIVIENELETIPEVAIARERLLFINEIVIDENGDTTASHAPGAGVTKLYPVNGVLDPTIAIAPGEVQRWRIAAANGDRFLKLKLDGHVLSQIALDGNTFAEPVEKDEILLLPGNRVEVLVKGGAEGTYALRALEYDRGFGGPVPEVTLATVECAGRAADQPLPAVLVPPPAGPSDASVVLERTFAFDVMIDGAAVTFGINRQAFDPDRIDASAVLGSTEEWVIMDRVGEEHPFHVHVNPFQVIEVNGVPVADPVWQDTALVPRYGAIKIRMTFADFTGRSVFHCHIAAHSDLGMMSAFEIY